MTSIDERLRERRRGVRMLDDVSSGRSVRLGAALLRTPRALQRLADVRGVRASVSERPRAGVYDAAIATICDDLTWVALDGVVSTIRLHPVVWRRQLERTRPTMLLIESAWSGRDGSWRYEVSNRRERPRGPLDSVVRWCRRRSIPVVFWSKEDPIWFERFLPVARLADVITTTDADAANWYEDLCPGTPVGVVPFFVNPQVHHPARPPDGVLSDRLVYAGSWANADYPERRRELAVLLDAAIERAGVDVYARGEGFPDRFLPHVRGRLSPVRLADVIKRYPAALNVNTVKESSTMCSRRVFETCASGVPVVSAPSRALDGLFDGAVIAAGGADEARAALEKVLDPTVRQHMSAASWRVVHERHTTQHRLARLERLVGVSLTTERAEQWRWVEDLAAARAATRFALADSVCTSEGASFVRIEAFEPGRHSPVAWRVRRPHVGEPTLVLDT